jgi:DNA-binding XRE family transcriptional regulator
MGLVIRPFRAGAQTKKERDLATDPIQHQFVKPSILGYILIIGQKALYIRFMLTLSSLGEQIAAKRKTLHLTQPALAKKARVGLSTLDALENERLGELGYSKITNILAALGLELKLQEARTRRPTLEELMEEEGDDQGLDRRR